MARLKEISRNSKEVLSATRCSKIPEKYLNIFFDELVKQRGILGSSVFVLGESSILSEAFDWHSSVKGVDFWRKLEHKMLNKEGITVEVCEEDVEEECCEKINYIRPKRSEELSAIHTKMSELLEMLKN
jgi:hypothetical protein